ncbi:hypothetical protein PT313_00435 [Metamycoplasma hyosynoviae]|uniref:hypothetical protein n=1 Tax=Metamycoplasma hyosynoviae TaxID=29559 RepID=UPI002358FD5B|nr:hypothetical protein [Metamycoplasma hyosynoviae]MDC8900196.1 hypothetical protein [Metamycoplasma hyosynoviae]MDC8915566.1 hypothetical protein [Metamycoplasma hyosynoviae]MDD1372728.1 hypothetical protein [Metamycoplasma hyosynoviae]MDD1373517.1 hypothetical protein [Metamycoplasma hyosynoviae]MDD1374069.1 hypothetical protein [Metamycoplasma hyosynoviae]
MSKNIEYFLESINTKSKNLNLKNSQGLIVIKRKKDKLYTNLEIKNQRLIELITTYKVIKDKNLDDEKIIEEILSILKYTKGINFSPFCTYLQVLGTSFLELKSKIINQEDVNSLIKIFLDEYIKNRHDLYLYHGYSNSMLQTIADNFSTKRKSITGIQMIVSELEQFEFKKVNAINEFNKNSRCYFLPDKGGKKLFLELKKNVKLNFNFFENNQNKLPDLIFKLYNHTFVIESKIINNKGGSQNHSINEIINFINQYEKQNNIHFVSCLDGNYFDDFDKDGNRKQNVQYDEILKHLKTNANNFFIKHSFIKKIINDYAKKKDE